MGYQCDGAIGGDSKGAPSFAKSLSSRGTDRLQYAEFALNHYGADTRGVNTARRFLCEALSFQHRYVPIGLLERMPPMMNERPPLYRGRSELGESRGFLRRVSADVCVLFV